MVAKYGVNKDEHAIERMCGQHRKVLEAMWICGEWWRRRQGRGVGGIGGDLGLDRLKY